VTDYFKRIERPAANAMAQPTSSAAAIKGSPMLHEYGDGEHFDFKKIETNQEKFFSKLSRVGYPEWKIIFEKNTKNSSEIAKILDGLYQYCTENKYKKNELITIFRHNISPAIERIAEKTKSEDFENKVYDNLSDSNLKELLDYTPEKFKDDLSTGKKNPEVILKNRLSIRYVYSKDTSYEKPKTKVTYERQLITEQVRADSSFKSSDIPNEVDIILKSYPFGFWSIFGRGSNFWGTLLTARLTESGSNINAPKKWRGDDPKDRPLIQYINTYAYFDGPAVEKIHGLLQEGKTVENKLIKEALIEINKKKKPDKKITERQVLDYIRAKKGFGANINYFVKEILKGKLKNFESLKEKLNQPLTVEQFYPDAEGKKKKTFTFKGAMFSLYQFLKNSDKGSSLESKFLEEILNDNKNGIDEQKIKAKLNDPDEKTREYNYRALALVLLKSAAFSAGLKVKTPEVQIQIATFEETFLAGDAGHFKGFDELKRRINGMGDNTSEADIKNIEKEVANTRNYLATVIDNSRETLSRPAEQQIKTNLLNLMTKLEELLAFKKHLIKEEKEIRQKYMAALKKPVNDAMKEVGIVRKDGRLIGLSELYAVYITSEKDRVSSLENFKNFLKENGYEDLENSASARNIRLMIQLGDLEDGVIFEKINGETKKIELLNSDTKVFAYQNITGKDPSQKVYPESTNYQLEIIPQYLSKLEKLDAYEQENLSEALIAEDVNIEIQGTAKPLGIKVGRFSEQSLENSPGSIYFEFTQQKNSNNVFGPQGKLNKSYSNRTIDFANAVIDSINGRAEKLAWKIDNMLNKNFNKDIILKNKAAVRLKNDLIMGNDPSEIKEEFKTDSLTLDDLIRTNRHDLILEKLNTDRNFKVLLNCVENDKKIPPGLMEVLPEEIKKVLNETKDKSEKIRDLLDIFRSTRPFLNKDDRNKLVDKLLADWNQRESILGTESNREKLNAKAEAQFREKQMTVRIVNADKLIKKLKERYKRGN